MPTQIIIMFNEVIVKSRHDVFVFLLRGINTRKRFNLNAAYEDSMI